MTADPLLVRGGDDSRAIQVDAILGSREIVVKAVGSQFSNVRGLSGATVQGDGSVILILDLPALVRSYSARDQLIHKEVIRDVTPLQTNLLVMVVDDSVTVRKVTSRLLEREGMGVLLAKDGLDALQMLSECERIPDVMLLDIEMPRMDGFEVASSIRGNSRLKDIPIIMISSRTGDKHRDRAARIGVNRFLGKPYQENELLKTIDTVACVSA